MNKAHRLWRHWTASTEGELARRKESRSRELGGSRCCDVQPRQRAVVAGPLRSVTLRPKAGAPALEAELGDGSGIVTLIWLGRRQIAGVHAGTWMRAAGMVCEQDGRRVIYNPRYEIRPGAPQTVEQA
ncbi:MAG: DNA-binding protein [Micrococcales bacterium]|nr:MAG: DNA-binding protein [Micrococcales bacterium]PIE27912.1 MAG: DNA-binding protein [Micrococcales bacterium]